MQLKVFLGDTEISEVRMDEFEFGFMSIRLVMIAIIKLNGEMQALQARLWRANLCWVLFPQRKMIVYQWVDTLWDMNDLID